MKHFAVIQYIQTRQALPVVRAGEYKPWDQEGTQPPLYHILAAVMVSWLDLSHFEEPPRNPHYADERSFIWRERGNNNLYLHTPGEEWSTDPVFLAARLARWLSLAAGAGTVALTYLLTRLIFDDETRRRGDEKTNPPLPRSPAPLLSALAAALVAFIPQFLHTHSAITNDSLSTTMAAAALVVLALVLKNGRSTRYTVYLGLILGLAAITKLSLLYLLPLTALVWLLDLRRHRSWRNLVMDAVIIIGLILLLAGWWYWRNWQLYGDFSALNAHLLYRGGALNPRPGLAQIWQTELTGLELSFWAAFGAGQILLEPWLYTILRGLKYLVGVGLVIGVWRWGRCWVSGTRGQGSNGEGQGSDDKGNGPRTTSHKPCSTQQLTQLFILGLWSLVVFVALLRWMQITPASWGRLLYPALPALAILTVWSLSQFTIHNSQFTIHNSQFPLVLAVALFSLSLISPFHYLRAAYAKIPLMAEAEIPAEGLERLDFTYDGSLRLIGCQVEKTPVRPGGWLPVTLYWQAIRPLRQNYSVFVHLLGQGNADIGQVNTYPAGGNWPTSMLEPGKVLKDTYYVPISPEAAAPAVIRLALGVFEFEDPARAAKPAVNAAGVVVEPIVGAVPLLPERWPEFDPAYATEINFGGQIRLIGYDWVNQKIEPGTRVPITFYWEGLAAPGHNLTLFIHLIDLATQAQVAGFDAPPDFPTGFWQQGYRIEDTRLLTLPENLPPGQYEVRIGWYNPETLARLSSADSSGDEWLLVKLTIESE